jgi:hypothetical protein
MQTRLLLLNLFLFTTIRVWAQPTAIVEGKLINNQSGTPVEQAAISVRGESFNTTSDSTGFFRLKVPAAREVVMVFSILGYETKTIKRTFRAESTNSLEVFLDPSIKYIRAIEIEDREQRRQNIVRLDPKLVSVMPTTGGIESLLKTLPGVSSNNEMSSQYNVRGGNFDENLIYVNDVEIYRPFLVRSGQQEGLSFINSDLVSNVQFSAGGFDAKYGDKMASVLDVTYRKPREFTGTATGSLLGGALHLEGKDPSSRFTWLMGVRQRSNQYILRSLDTQGDYRPLFIDGQALLNYDFTPEFSLQFLGNYSRNQYRLVPETRQTDFGTVNEALRLTVYFDGQEVNDFETYLGALSGIYKPNKDLTLKIIGSAYRSFETETFDVQGQYYIDQLENDFGKDSFGEVKFNRGVGTFLNHARNNLTVTVANLEHKGYYKNWLWGTRYQVEDINDRLSEWRMIDSAGFSIPLGNPDVIELDEVIKQKINLPSQRFSQFLQYNKVWKGDTEYSLNAGFRTSYWTVNKEFLFSPRATFSVLPNWEKDWLFRFSTGVYYQPPFYRELRDFSGNLNTNLKAQRSIHFVVAGDHNFLLWNRPFKLTTELYYKHLSNLVPYEIDNVRIRYYAENSARGYATGVDMRLYGEFVNGIESWFSLSVMRTAEDILNDFYYVRYNSDGNVIVPGFTTNSVAVDSARIEPGYIPRPTDQRVNFSIFFQDYLPKLPQCKMHLNLLFGSGMPFGPPTFERYKDTLRMPPYRRVDIGFSYQILSEEKRAERHNAWKHLRSMWVSVEVFNLLQVNNTISYLWIKDVTNRMYAIPNYLTNRQLNIKLITRF